MGNNSTNSAGHTSVHNTSTHTNSSLGVFPSYPDGLLWSGLFGASGLSEVLDQCHVQTDREAWLGVKIFFLLTGLPANAMLTWILLHKKTAMTPSEVLGLNVSIMDLLYCVCLPLDCYITLNQASHTLHSVRESLSALNTVGCPLLLTAMCVERYVAVAWPVLFIRLARSVYRVLLCVCVWTLTLAAALLTFYLGLFSIALPLSVSISLLFLTMLLCLLGIVCVLCEDGPNGPNSLKKRALNNILVVMLPSVLAYSPLVALVPYMAVIISAHTESISAQQCSALQLILVFPNIGLFIGPLFYLAKLRQVNCCSKEEMELTSRTQAE